MHLYMYIKILNYITNDPTCFTASATFSGRPDIVFVKVTEFINSTDFSVQQPALRNFNTFIIL